MIMKKSQFWLINKELAMEVGLKAAAVYAFYLEQLDNDTNAISASNAIKELPLSAFEFRKAKTQLIDHGYIKVTGAGLHNIDHITILK